MEELNACFFSESENIMTKIIGRIIALDIGKKRIGLAISDPLGISASPAGFIKCQGFKKTVREIVDVIEEKETSGVVVGIPFKTDGTMGESAEMASRYVDRLRNLLSIPVETVDERFTTAEAQKLLIEADVSRSKRKQVIDGMAASLILQKYMEGLRRNQDNE